MKVNIIDIRKTQGASQEVLYAGPLRLGDLHLDGPVQVSLRLTNAMSRILVRGKIGINVTVECSRCAEPCTLAVRADIDEEFLPQSSPEVAEADSAPWSDLNVFHDEANEIDLTEVLRQNAIAAFPIQPLCKEDCRGLCPMCGENLNRAECTCLRTDIDPRLHTYTVTDLRQHMKR